jgi:hypothetical protein
MTIAIIIFLAVALCVITGFAARQMQDLRDNAITLSEKDLQIEDLTRENEGLRQHNSAHERNLEMVIAELDKSA